jgi:hypothetical protein
MAFALVLSLDRLLVPQSAPGWQLPLGGMLPSSSSRSQAVAWAEIAILERAAIGSLAFRLAFGRQNGYERPKFRCSTPNNAPPSLPYNSALRVNHAPNPHASLFPLLGGGVPRGLCRRRVVGSPHSYPSLHPQPSGPCALTPRLRPQPRRRSTRHRRSRWPPSSTRRLASRS